MSEKIWPTIDFKTMTPKQIKEAYELIFQSKPNFVNEKNMKIWNKIDFSFLTPHQIKNIYNHLFISGKY
jgi:hypothetical protein